MNMECVQDVDVYTEANDATTSSIYVVDSCTMNVLHFVAKNSSVATMNAYTVANGVPISSVRISSEHLVVLTKQPSQMIIISLNKS